VLYGRREQDRLVGGGFHRDDLSASPETVRGEQRLRAGVLQPAGDGVGAVSGEQGQDDAADGDDREKTAATSSGHIGMNNATRSPRPMPMRRNPFAQRWTSRRNCS
jgi:hypothetical protein